MFAGLPQDGGRDFSELYCIVGFNGGDFGGADYGGDWQACVSEIVDWHITWPAPVFCAGNH